MKRLALVPVAVALVAALAPASAPAKGASRAEITGPDLDGSITLSAGGLRSKLGMLAQETGFYPAVFSQIPDPMLAEQPEGVLGPRYRITWVMPGPDGLADRIGQDLYPYATPSPVTYVEPRQSVFGTERTHGGWYVAARSLRDDLVAVGLPRTPPAGDDGSGLPWTVVGVLGAIGLGLALVTVAAVRVRRKPGPATA
jgi:hypothetical protein